MRQRESRMQAEGKGGEFTSGFIRFCHYAGFAKEGSQCLSDAGKIKRLSQGSSRKATISFL